MRPIVGNTSSEGKKPSTPTIGTASAGNAQATVPFTESTYRGKTNSGTYRATSTPGSITGTCAAPCSSITVTGLSNGTAYTFTVQLETPYGVNSDLSASSNSVTPVAPTTTTTTTTTTTAAPVTTTTTTTAAPVTTTTTTTTTAAPVCPDCGGVPPGGDWVYGYDYQACIQMQCGPFIGNWKAYFKYCSNGAVHCSYGLFIICDYSNSNACPT